MFIINFICIIIICFVTPISSKATFHEIKYKQNNNNHNPTEFVDDGGCYEIEHYSNIYGIDIWQINNKPNWAE